MNDQARARRMPREIAPGVFWFGECLEMDWHGQVLHNYQSMYLVTGETCSLLVDSSHPQYFHLLAAQLEELLARPDVPELRYLFITHSETPHAGGVARLMEHYPELILCGDVTDAHLYAPRFASRSTDEALTGDGIDLGGTRFRAVPAVIRDHINTCWGFDSARRVLFSADGQAYAHYHEPDQCGCLAEEADTLDIADMTTLFAELALYWTRFVDMEPYITRLDELIADLDVRMIAPTHGLPIGNLTATMPAVRAGLRAGAAANPEGDTYFASFS